MHYPRHIGIIPDGNRTWAKEKGKLQLQWHRAGYLNTLTLVEYMFAKTPIEAVTFRWLSTENIKQRSKEELDYLYEFAKQLKKDLGKILEKYHINFKRAGTANWLPNEIVALLQTMQDTFVFPTNKYMTMAINYGGRDEVIRGIQRWVREDGDGEQLTEEKFSSYMDFSTIPVIDLVIRTKSELASRISWFMLRWIGYAELFFSKFYFPDFGVTQLEEALIWFDERAQARNFGK